MPALASACLVMALCAAAAQTAEPTRTTIHNDLVRVTIDAEGRLAELANVRTKWNYAANQGLWRIFYTENEVRDVEATAAGQPQVVADASGITLRYDALESPQKKRLDIVVELKASIRAGSDDVTWTIALQNRQPGLVVTEVQFPLVGDLQLRPGQALIYSRQGGHRNANPKALVRGAHSRFMGPDQNGIKWGIMYPGVAAATNCYVFDAKDEGLYCGSHDPSLQSTLHLMRLDGEQLQAGFVKYPFLAKGQKYASAPFVLSPYSGTWHVASKKYRTWANTWFHPPRPPDWVRQMTGWQRIILIHQYGEVLHPYNTIAQMAADGRTAGVDSLLLFGWWKAGMDAGYPDYSFDEALGGRQKFADQIRAAQAAGTRVQVYFNGRLIDKESEFYRSGEGRRTSIKDLRGNEWNESYHFSGNGTTSWQLGRKTFVIACPTSASWQKRRLEWVDRTLALGADAVFFDQMGINETPCTDPSHGHAVPLVSFTQSQIAQLREIRQHVRAVNPNAAFGTEIITDVVGSECDYLHSVSGMYQPGGFVEWFRYTFPEVIFSDREIYDDTDIERRVNILLTRGLRSDVCIWRCRGTIADTPHYREYLGKVNALRTKHREFLLEGTYRDNEPLRSSNAVIDARAFQSGERLMVAMAQSQADEAKTLLQVPGYRLVSSDGLGGYRVQPEGQELRVTLKRNAVALAIFRKTK
jgi:hypothetical protein